MPVFSQITDLFDSCQIKYQVLHHDAVVTCEDAARIRGTKPEQGAKALVVCADGQPRLLVLPCSRKLDFKLYKSWQQVRDLRMATPDEVLQLTTLVIGSIPPTGNVMNLPTFVDETLLTQDQISFNAGDHKISIIMNSKDYLTAVNPAIGNFSMLKNSI